MKEKVNMYHAATVHLRGIKELHRVSPKFFPVLTLHCIVSAVTPYITVFFSAQILKELAILRRADILWKWVVASVLCVGIVTILKAVLWRRYQTLLNDLWGRKEILFIHKTYIALQKHSFIKLRHFYKQTSLIFNLSKKWKNKRTPTTKPLRNH